MLPACVTIPATGGDVTKILPAFWLCVTIPASGEDVTIVFSALSLCVIVAATLSDGTVKMPISINEGSCSTSAHKDHWLKATCLGRLKCKFKKCDRAGWNNIQEKVTSQSTICRNAFAWVM